MFEIDSKWLTFTIPKLLFWLVSKQFTNYVNVTNPDKVLDAVAKLFILTAFFVGYH